MLVVVWCAYGAVALKDDDRRQPDVRLMPAGRAHHNRHKNVHEVVTNSDAPKHPGSGLAHADLEDLLTVITQRQHLNPRPSLLPFLVNPFSPLLLCDHHYGTEREIHPDIVINPLDERKARLIKPCEAVCVNAQSFDAFTTDVLPLMPSKIVLFTSRLHLPQVERSRLTDAVKAHPNISHWFAQNPVYPSDERYTAFPYGIQSSSLEAYVSAFLAHHMPRGLSGINALAKNKTIEHLPFKLTHPSRAPFLTDGVRDMPDMKPPLFYERIARAKFLVSPRGDRQDTFRHWEAIGLGARPIANINKTLYGSLFGMDMVYMEDAGEIISLLDDRAKDSLEQQYHVPGAHRLSSLFWARKVEKAREACLQQASEGANAKKKN